MQRNLQGRVLGILIVLVLLGAAGAAAWYFLIFTKSPQYALNQFFTAAKANDSEKVGQWTNPAGQLTTFLTMVATMNPNMASADPVSAIYPGYKSTVLGQTESVQIGEFKVEGDEARAVVTMTVKTPEGGTSTIKPTYVLRKNADGKWQVAVEPTLGGSFNEFVSKPMRDRFEKQIRLGLRQNPMAQSMVKPYIEGMRAELEKYPQVRDFFKRSGLL